MTEGHKEINKISINPAWESLAGFTTVSMLVLLLYMDFIDLLIICLEFRISLLHL